MPEPLSLNTVIAIAQLVIPFWILDCRFWIEERLTGQASHVGSHSANFISCIFKSNWY